MRLRKQPPPSVSLECSLESRRLHSRPVPQPPKICRLSVFLPPSFSLPPSCFNMRWCLASSESLTSSEEHPPGLPPSTRCRFSRRLEEIFSNGTGSSLSDSSSSSHISFRSCGEECTLQMGLPGMGGGNPTRL